MGHDDIGAFDGGQPGRDPLAERAPCEQVKVIHEQKKPDLGGGESLADVVRGADGPFQNFIRAMNEIGSLCPLGGCGQVVKDVGYIGVIREAPECLPKQAAELPELGVLISRSAMVCLELIAVNADDGSLRSRELGQPIEQRCLADARYALDIEEHTGSTGPATEDLRHDVGAANEICWVRHDPPKEAS